MLKCHVATAQGALAVGEVGELGGEGALVHDACWPQLGMVRLDMTGQDMNSCEKAIDAAWKTFNI